MFLKKPASFISLLLLLNLFCLPSFSQCLTDFEKILPDSTVSALQDYGFAVAIHGDYVAVGSPANDSIKHNGGLVFIYQKSVDNYKKVATIFPKGDQHYSNFGYSLDMNDDYLVVSAVGDNSSQEGSAKPHVYIFKKSIDGWKDNVSEIALSGYGKGLFGAKVHITDDSQNILVGNMHISEGSVFSLRIGPSGWEEGVSYQEIQVDPKYLVDAVNIDLGESFAMHNEYLTIAAKYVRYNGKNNGIFVFKDESGAGLDYQPIAILQGSSSESFFLGKVYIDMDDQYVYCSIYQDYVSGFAAYPKGAEWHDDNGIVFIPYTEDRLNVTARSMKVVGDYIYVTGLVEARENLFIFHRDSIGNESYYPKRIILREGVGASWFGSAIDAYGTDLIIGNHRYSDFNYSNGVAELFDTSSDIVTLKHTLSETFYDATDHYFGNNLHYTKDGYLLVGAPKDSEEGTQYGAAYIYKEHNGAWVRSGKLVPPGRDKNDRNFGSAIASSGKDFVIGAPGFRPEGMVFIYKNTSVSGIDLKPETIVFPHDTMKVEGFGTSVAIENNLMAVSGHEISDTYRHAVFIYEREAHEWHLKEVLILSKVSPLEKNAFLSVDIYDQQILVGNPTSSAVGFMGGAGELVTKDKQEGKWKVTSRFTQPRAGSYNSFGALAKITENHIFIGAPNMNIAGIENVGAVYVYTKPPQGWPATTNQAVEILPYDKIENGLFGHAFEAIENTLIVGAPMADYKYVGDGIFPFPNPINIGKTPIAVNEPGATYVIQALDYQWKETVPFLKLQGESLSELDHYGYSVALSQDHLFIGATFEDTKEGHNSGAVYATNMPPLVKVVPPVCIKDGPIDLFGYPYGGVWDGPGITDVDLGIFDPAIAGVGEHLLIYETPNCAYTGKLKVVVNSGPAIISTSPINSIICEGVPAQLSVQAEDATSYEWFYKEEEGDTFYPIPESNKAVWEAFNTGSYYSVIKGTWRCAVISDTFSVEMKHFDIDLIADTKVICPKGGVNITSNAPNHTDSFIWYYREQGHGEFIMIGKDESIVANKAGDYRQEALIHSCVFYSDTITLTNKTLDVIIEEPEIVCSQDKPVYLKASPTGGVWSGLGISDGNVGVFDASGLGNGIYPITYTFTDGACTYTATTDVEVEVAGPLSLLILDEEVCLSRKPTIGTKSNEQYVNLEWYHAIGKEHTLIASNVPEVEIHHLGTYYAIGKLHDCLVYSDTVHLRAKPNNLFVPNVFTPNGDAFNEEFQILGENIEDFYLKIINRWGRVVFETRDRNNRWKAENSPAGIYYYAINYKDCYNKYQQLTGPLTVMK